MHVYDIEIRALHIPFCQSDALVSGSDEELENGAGQESAPQRRLRHPAMKFLRLQVGMCKIKIDIVHMY